MIRDDSSSSMICISPLFAWEPGESRSIAGPQAADAQTGDQATLRKVAGKGLALIPLKMYFRNGKVRWRSASDGERSSTTSGRISTQGGPAGYGKGPPGEKQGLLKRPSDEGTSHLSSPLDLAGERTILKPSFKSLHIHGGVTVSTGIVEAVEAYRGSYRPR